MKIEFVSLKSIELIQSAVQCKPPDSGSASYVYHSTVMIHQTCQIKRGYFKVSPSGHGEVLFLQR